MIIQIILSSCFFFIALYGVAHLRKIKLVSTGMILLSVVAIYFIWNPGITNTLANLIGIGRGADLMMYCFLVFVIFQLIVLHVKLHTQTMLLTKLARRVAIEGAKIPQDVEDRRMF
jgi:hypothetical protein